MQSGKVLNASVITLQRMKKTATKVVRTLVWVNLWEHPKPLLEAWLMTESVSDFR